jgi:hypothetical protein
VHGSPIKLTLSREYIIVAQVGRHGSGVKGHDGALMAWRRNVWSTTKREQWVGVRKHWAVLEALQVQSPFPAVRELQHDGGSCRAQLLHPRVHEDAIAM